MDKTRSTDGRVDWLRLARLAGGAAFLIAASNPSLSDLIANRREHMAEMNSAMLELGQQIAGGRASRAVVVAQADRIATLAPSIPSWFRRGSGIESGLETAALPAIWQKSPDFVARAAGLAAAARGLQTLARRGSAADVAAQARAVDRACVACHRDFRLPD